MDKTKRTKVENIVKRNFFYSQTASIYQGSAGLYDFGPLGHSLKENILVCWKSFFKTPFPCVSEISSALISPKAVFLASGHIEKFEDLMFKDQVTGTILRADKYLKEVFLARRSKLLKQIAKRTTENLEKKLATLDSIVDEVEAMNKEAIDELVVVEEVKSPDGNPLSPAKPFNLMFAFALGANSENMGYLRPETAQGIFTNFAPLFRWHGSLPFGCVQTGKGFRNEISPRSGMLRLREFDMAELEFFYDKEALFQLDKEKQLAWVEEHLSVSALKTTLAEVSVVLKLPSKDAKTFSLWEAFANSRVIENPLVVFFLLQTKTFCTRLGLQNEAVRFRKHEPTEMAHYASDCWDLELLSSYGWMECAGIADRGVYDLFQHGKHSGENFNKLTGASPSVVEPSFGLNRLLYCLLENCVWTRTEDPNRNVLSLPMGISPLPFVVIPLHPKEALKNKAKEVHKLVLNTGFACRVDLASQNMGKKYARNDEIGVNFIFTVDYQTLEDNTLTIRERDSKTQKRVACTNISKVVRELVNNYLSVF